VSVSRSNFGFIGRSRRFGVLATKDNFHTEVLKGSFSVAYVLVLPKLSH
jgi:hypothetical protein